MIWALDGQVAARAAAVVRPDHRRARSPRSLAHLQRGAGPGHRRGRAQRRVRRERARVRRRGARPHRPRRASSASTRRRWSSTCCPAPSATCFEDELRAEHGVTVGHWPQSMALSTVGGWLACRGAGQLSTRYGKIEDIVIGLDVVLADGTPITTGGAPRAAVGPDLTQLFVGSEGTLGIIVGARLRAAPEPAGRARAPRTRSRRSTTALDACRRILQRGATPAVLRLYDAIEADRNVPDRRRARAARARRRRRRTSSTRRMARRRRGVPRPPSRSTSTLVEQWMEHRNDVSALEALIRRGFVVDTMEIAGTVGALPHDLRAHAPPRSRAVEHTLVASAHQTHAYTDGALPLLHVRRPARPRTSARRYYRAVWDAGTRAVLAHGGALSHHHGVGLNRARFVADALGAGFDVLAAVKRRARPERHPQPRQARPARRRSARSPGRERTTEPTCSSLDVGTSGVRAAIVARRRAPSRTKSVPRAAARLAEPRPRRVRRRRDGAHAASTSPRAALAAAGPVDAVGITNQRGSTIVWDRATGEPVGPGHRLAGPPHRRRVPRAARARACASRRTSRPRR